mmetsp:Transcript_10481/g.19613  ORF Transcript_10481/g.19613 Transcript_10481/m.19613 type:complete len:338 (+) Transcript_10481:828-1841(+)
MGHGVKLIDEACSAWHLGSIGLLERFIPNSGGGPGDTLHLVAAGGQVEGSQCGQTPSYAVPSDADFVCAIELLLQCILEADAAQLLVGIPETFVHLAAPLSEVAGIHQTEVQACPQLLHVAGAPESQFHHLLAVLFGPALHDDPAALGDIIAIPLAPTATHLRVVGIACILQVLEHPLHVGWHQQLHRQVVMRGLRGRHVLSQCHLTFLDVDHVLSAPAPQNRFRIPDSLEFPCNLHGSTFVESLAAFMWRPRLQRQQGIQLLQRGSKTQLPHHLPVFHQVNLASVLGQFLKLLSNFERWPTPPAQVHNLFLSNFPALIRNPPFERWVAEGPSHVGS